MLTESSSGMTKVVTSLKVAALVSILGAVVLAAEHELDRVVPAEQTAASAIIAPQDGSANSRVQPAASDYFPAQFPAPSGPVADQPQTF
jgi:hypothetical protein